MATLERFRIHPLLPIVVVALLLRVIGIAFGSPGHVHPDEAQYMATALGMAANRAPVPGDYHNPHFLTNLCLLLIGGTFGALKAVGITPDVGAYKAFVWSHTFVFLFLARLVSALAGTGTVVLTYALARRLGDRRAALLAAGLLAVSFLHVRDSHFATNDVLMTSMVVATVLASMRYFEHPTMGRLVFAGALAGIAAGTKYNGGIVIVSAFTAVLAAASFADRRFALTVRRVAVCGLAAMVGFVASNPQTLLAARHVLDGFLAANALAAMPWPGQSPRSIPLQMLDTVVLGGGLCTAVAAVWGVSVTAQRARWATFIIAATPLAYVALMFRAHAFGARLMILVLPFVAAFAGAGISDLFSRLQRSQMIVRPVWVTAVAALLVIEPLARSLYLDDLLTRLDSRRDVEQWLLDRPEVFEHAVIDSPTASAFANPTPPGVRVVAPSEMAAADPSTFLGPGVRYAVLSNAVMRPGFDALWKLCLIRGKAIMESSPYRMPGRIPEVDDGFAPYHDIFEWSRPGMVVRVFDLQPDRHEE